MSHSPQQSTMDRPVGRVPPPGAPSASPARSRFTLDGSTELEQKLEALCRDVLLAVRQSVRPELLEGLVLAGGYGRGQGGVLRTPEGDRPYNDLEFYVFVRGSFRFDSGRIASRLNASAEDLSSGAGLHVEFKVDSLAQLRRRPISMFSYDLLAAHRILHGTSEIFRGCEHHLDPKRLPLSEATRLLFNRGTGLLLAKRLLRQDGLSTADADFIGRNLAKAQLALGDAVLAAGGDYHWDCLERHRRLMIHESLFEGLPLSREIRACHQAGVDFKLHPRKISHSIDVFRHEHQTISELAAKLWLRLESRRLATEFRSPGDYSVSRLNKCPETSPWKNCLLNLRTLGPAALGDPASLRYPRNRLLNSLPVLLWNGELANEPALLKHVQAQLHTRATSWNELVNAYENIWRNYG